MKSKLLIPTITLGVLTPTIALTGCNNQKSDSEDVIDAIIAPTKLTQTKPVDSLLNELKQLDESGKQKEIIYDLFGIFNLSENKYFKLDKPLTKMWEDNSVSFKTNITKCSMNIDGNNNIISSFLGYVSFVFNDTIKGKLLDETTGNFVDVTFKSNDYIMITYDFFNANVTLSDNFALTYQPKLSLKTGFWKIKYNDGADETLYDVGLINTDLYKIKNSNNWVPKE